MPRILLADDNEGTLAKVGLALREQGHEVTSTNSGGDALSLAEKRPYDLLILDLGMPDLDGYDVLRLLGPKAPPVVIITGGRIEEDSLDRSRVGRVVRKPFTYEQLLSAVRDVLGQPAGEG